MTRRPPERRATRCTDFDRGEVVVLKEIFGVDEFHARHIDCHTYEVSAYLRTIL